MVFGRLWTQIGPKFEGVDLLTPPRRNAILLPPQGDLFDLESYELCPCPPCFCVRLDEI